MTPSASLPVLVLQPQLNDGPAYLATWLREQGIAYALCSVEAGDTVPVDASAFSALALLGGSMSANDELPFLQRTRQLLRSALALGVPVPGLFTPCRPDALAPERDERKAQNEAGVRPR